MKKNYFNYDEKNDIFTIHKGFTDNETFDGNIDTGNIIFDVSTKGRIRGVEIMDATRFFNQSYKLSPTNIKEIQKRLQVLNKADFKAQATPNGMIITLFTQTKKLTKIVPTKIALPLEMRPNQIKVIT